MKQTDIKNGDLVEILNSTEIKNTLDENGCLDKLPFMPEMAKFCGKRFVVKKKFEQFCFDGASLCGKESAIREFRNNDVYKLNNLRCSGHYHGNCKKGCTLFWKKAWMRKINPDESQIGITTIEDSEESRFWTAPTIQSSDPAEYLCQSSELLRASCHLSLYQRLSKLVASVRFGNASPLDIFQSSCRWAFWKAVYIIYGDYPRGNNESTPSESKKLKRGDWVRVKSLSEIRKTLNKNGRNRGLHFTSDMVSHCGKKYRVESIADRFITEGTGQMRKMKNTVVLKNLVYDGIFYVFGGCYREPLHLWREIWLEKLDGEKSDNESSSTI